MTLAIVLNRFLNLALSVFGVVVVFFGHSSSFSFEVQ